MMKFNTFLLSDKTGLNYFRFVFIPLFVLSISLFAENSVKTTLVGLIILSVPIILYTGFYGSSYVNYLLQQRFLDFNKETITRNEVKKVVLFQKGFTISPPKINFPAKINVDPREVTYTFITIGKETVMLGYVHDLGRFKRYLKPLHLTDAENAPKITHTQKVSVQVRSDNNSTEIHFLKGEYGIVKLRLTDSN